jgi:hypothetical protein
MLRAAPCRGLSVKTLSIVFGRDRRSQRLVFIYETCTSAAIVRCVAAAQVDNNVNPIAICKDLLSKELDGGDWLSREPDGLVARVQAYTIP